MAVLSRSDLRLSEALFRRHTDESEAVVRSAFDAFLTDFFDRAHKDGWPSDGLDKPIMLVLDHRVSAESAERNRARLLELTHEIAEAEPGDTQVNVLLGCYRPRT
jgi:hypothetical protein